MHIDSMATTLGAINHITSNPSPPTDPAQLQEDDKKEHTLRALIITTTPPDILNLLSIAPDPTPYDLIDAILAHLKTNTANDHKYLKTEAENLHLTPDMSIDEYVTKHNALRARMIAVQFPITSDETTSVDFMIEGLCYKPESINIGRQLLAINSPTVKAFIHHYHRSKSYNMTVPSILTSTIYSPSPPAPVQALTPLNYTTHPKTRQAPYSHLQYQPQGFRPCSFHQQFMRVPPNHSDDQCRDTRHPKFNRAPKPQPQAQAPIGNASSTMAFTPPFPPYLTYNWAYPSFSFPAQNYAKDPLPEQPQDSNKVEGMLTLDSAAHPTHITSPPPYLPRRHNISTRTAANHLAPSTHAGNIQIPLHPKHPPLDVPCVASPSLHSNLLSVHDIAIQYGAVLFTPQAGYILNLRDGTKPPIVSSAPWHKQRYLLHSYPTTPHVFGARTIITTPAGRKNRPATKRSTPPPPPRNTPPTLRQTPTLPSKRHNKPIITPRLNQLPVHH